MKISLNWLKDYLNIDMDYYEISRILTETGLEVESVEHFESVKGSLNGLVIGQVKTCIKHPNADKLSITTVDIGNGQILPIVCGAPNVAAGQKVVVATIGTTLYMGSDSFEIKKSKIRGEISEGMICAEDEIGIGTSHDGIIVLPDHVAIGIPASKYFQIYTDTVFEIGITPNRIDGASHMGVARDIAAYINKSGINQKNVTLLKPDVTSFTIDSTSMNIPVTVETEEACIRYSGVCITDITVKESPEWLQNRLKAIGQRPLNNVVDVTNYLLHEMGQPLHAFDADYITGNKIIVKTLAENTEFITLDAQKRNLSNLDLMICNEKEGMCLAGVFGGLSSGVSQKTTRIFLESACFSPTYIRKTSKRHLLHTDAAFRFERGTDPEITIYALKRAALLIKEVAGGKIASNISDIYPNPVEKAVINLRYKQLNRLTGKIIDGRQVETILKNLDFEIESQTPESITVKAPTYRVDVTREADVIEEILRIYGYNNIEIPESVNSTLSYVNNPDKSKEINRVSDFLCNRGFNEAMSNSLTKYAYYESLLPEQANNTVKILNPLSNDLNAMRQSLVFGNLEAVIHNLNRKNDSIKLFEFGNCYTYGKQLSDNKNNLKNYYEQTYVSLVITGKKHETNWILPKAESDFYYLKSHTENVFLFLGLKLKDFTITETTNQLFNYGLKYEINNTIIAEAGQISNKIGKAFDIEQNVFYTEINFTALLKLLPVKIKYNPISKFPEVNRDLALLVDKNITFNQIKTTALETEKKYLQNINIFDIYENEKLGENKKSYAVSFTFLNKENTFTDVQIEKIMSKLTNAFKNDLNAQIRS